MIKKFKLKNESSEVKLFELKEFSLRPTVEAEHYEEAELVTKKGFVLNESSSKKSGVSYLKDKRIESEISRRVSERLEIAKKEAFEEATSKGYQEGFAKGQEQGIKDVLEQFSQDVESSISLFNGAVEDLTHVRKNLVKENKKDLINLIKLTSEKICLKEITIDNSVKEHTNEEKLKFFLAESDYKHLTEFLAKIKKDSVNQDIIFEVNSEVSSGGLVLEVKNGHIDKTIETRFNKAWDAYK
jgi:flagellar assembly protein FliH